MYRYLYEIRGTHLFTKHIIIKPQNFLVRNFISERSDHNHSYDFVREILTAFVVFVYGAMLCGKRYQKM